LLLQLTGKLPAVPIYDTDNTSVVYEHRIKESCDKLKTRDYEMIGDNILNY